MQNYKATIEFKDGREIDLSFSAENQRGAFKMLNEKYNLKENAKYYLIQKQY